MIVQFLVALVATVSFAVLYDAPQKELLFSGLSGAVGWVVYLYLTDEMQINKVFACVTATLILTLIARILAVVRCCPVTVYLLVSIFPLVPGTGIYYTSYYLITRQNELFAATGLATFETAAAIAFGIAMGFGLPQSWFWIFQRPKTLRRQEIFRGREELQNPEGVRSTEEFQRREDIERKSNDT